MFILALIDFAVCFNQAINLQEELLLNPLNDLFVFSTVRISICQTNLYHLYHYYPDGLWSALKHRTADKTQYTQKIHCEEITDQS